MVALVGTCIVTECGRRKSKWSHKKLFLTTFILIFDIKYGVFIVVFSSRVVENVVTVKNQKNLKSCLIKLF